MDKKDFIAYMKSQELTNNTIKTYGTYIDVFFQELDPPTQPNIIRFINDYESKNVPRAAVKKWLEFYSFHTKSDRYNAIKIPKKRAKKKGIMPKFLSEQEQYDIVNSPILTDFEKIFVRLLFETGCRITEILNVKIKHINDDQTVFIETTKTEQRNVYITKRTYNLLVKYLRGSQGLTPEDYLIPFRTRQRGYQIIHKIGRKVLQRNIHPHMFRHSCGYNMTRKGGKLREIQEYLGHKDISSTTIYTAQTQEQIKNLFKKVNNEVDE